ncbi:hypothetical protein HPP92_018422 [Vanilla planifolia]|uniref:CREG-like beta-barrel domain-containing protein n=1 Tax=Vanilla planifolia TaxID=51239 RepID=A0A835QFK3_VANPL|nr:hypothetical protein HPP92_018422 [Vanilla planifolia]
MQGCLILIRFWARFSLLFCTWRFAKAMLLNLKLVDNHSVEAEFAQNALFAKHPDMKGWPKNHNFEIFKLDIENLFLLDWYGGPKPLTPKEYFRYEEKEIHSY